MGNWLQSKIDLWFGSSDKQKRNIFLFVLGMVVLSRLMMVGIYLVFRLKTGTEQTFFEALRHYDADWYTGIIYKGYRTDPIYNGTVDWAYFPFMPLMVKAFCQMGFHNINVVGFFVNTMAFTWALYLGFRYILLTRNSPVTGVVFSAFMCFGAHSFYFSCLYTESFYLLLLTAALYCLEQKKYLWAGVVGALLSATRNTGVMIIFAIAVHFIIQENRQKRSWKDWIPDFFKNHRLVLGTALVPLGLFLFMLFLKNLTGDPFAFMRAQVAWGRSIGNPFRNVYVSLRSVNAMEFRLALWALAGLFLIWRMVRNKRWVECIMAIILLLIPLATGITSIHRYMLGSFVFALVYIEEVLSWKRLDFKVIAFGWFFIIEPFQIMMWFNGAGLC